MAILAFVFLNGRSIFSSYHPNSPIENNEQSFYNKAMSAKVYVKVLAEFSLDGQMVPVQIIWPDGREFPIDRILDVGPGVTKSGGSGIRYLCRIQGKVVPLYFGATSHGKKHTFRT